MGYEDKKKTAFSCEQGLWHCNIMSFGLTKSPGVFDRLIKRVLERKPWKAAYLYLDDVLVFGNSFHDELTSEVSFLDMPSAKKVRGLTRSKSQRWESGHPSECLRAAQFSGSVHILPGVCERVRRHRRPTASHSEEGAPYNWSEECNQALVPLK